MEVPVKYKILHRHVIYKHIGSNDCIFVVLKPESRVKSNHSHALCMGDLKRAGLVWKKVTVTNQLTVHSKGHTKWWSTCHPVQNKKAVGEG